MLPDEPFEEKPNIRDPEPGRVYCFINSNRPCTMECVAYLITRPEGRDYENQVFSQCSLLVNAHRAGKHLTVLASQGDSLLKHLRIKAADAVREVNSPTAVVKGG